MGGGHCLVNTPGFYPMMFSPCHLCQPLSHDGKWHKHFPIHSIHLNSDCDLNTGSCAHWKRCSGCSQAVRLARCSQRSKPSRNAAGSNEIKEIGKSLLSVGTSRAVCLQCFQWEQSSDLINIQVTVCMFDNKCLFLDESPSLSHHRACSFKYSHKDYRIMQLGNWCFIYADFSPRP